VSPPGRLPLTFYRNVADLPPFSDYSMKNRTYRYFTGTPVYPFGYGLSFTTFDYAPLKVEPIDGSLERGVRVTTTVTNTGKRSGEEVAQLYLEPPRYDGAPRLALRGFQRFELKPGERKTITLTLSPRDLSFVTRDGVRQVMAGEYRVNVGSGQPGTGVASQSAAFSVPRAIAVPE
jgi:beta-glucosidase